jgi:hypothetical protein
MGNGEPKRYCIAPQVVDDRSFSVNQASQISSLGVSQGTADSAVPVTSFVRTITAAKNSVFRGVPPATSKEELAASRTSPLHGHPTAIFPNPANLPLRVAHLRTKCVIVTWAIASISPPEFCLALFAYHVANVAP